MPTEAQETLPVDKSEITPKPTMTESPNATARSETTAPAEAPMALTEPVRQSPSETADEREIRRIGGHFGARDMAEDHIVLGTPLVDFRTLMRQRNAERLQAVPVAPRIQSRVPYTGTLRAFRPELYDGGRREAEEQAYRAGMFCRAVLFGNEEAQRWCRDHSVQLAVATKDMRMVRALTGVAAGQAVLVPDELVTPIINLREDYGVARQRCQIHPMMSDTASVPRRSGGATAYFVGRETAVTASDPALDNVNLTARNVAAETRISNDYAEDSAIDLADFVANEHALAFATKEDNCLMNGDGTSTYGGIVGIRTAILGLAGAIDAASAHDTFLEIDSADLDGVVGALPEIPGLMPSWYASKRGEALMMGRLRTAAGGNTKTDMAGRVARQWDGDDIVISQAMPKGTGATDYSDVVMAIYGDLRMGVVFGDRRGMTMMTDPYSLSSYQQTKIIHSERFDIACHGVGDASEAGPIVALIGE